MIKQQQPQQRKRELKSTYSVCYFWFLSLSFPLRDEVSPRVVNYIAECSHSTSLAVALCAHCILFCIHCKTASYLLLRFAFIISIFSLSFSFYIWYLHNGKVMCMSAKRKKGAAFSSCMKKSLWQCKSIVITNTRSHTSNLFR